MTIAILDPFYPIYEKWCDIYKMCVAQRLNVCDDGWDWIFFVCIKCWIITFLIAVAEYWKQVARSLEISFLEGHWVAVS